jgi:hypothetical protein
MAPIFMSVNINKIFDLFESGSEQKSEEDVMFIDIKNTPIYWVGMFKKLIQNNHIFTSQIVGFFDKINPEIDIENLKGMGDRVSYERAYYYLSKIDITDKMHQDSISLNIDKQLLKALEQSILFFQEYEEYEKCAFIKKILDFTKTL